MMVIGQLTNGRMAQAFIDYMMGLGVVCKISQEENAEFIISIEHSEDHSRTMDEYNQFIDNPNDNKYLAASWQSANPQIHVEQDGQANMSLLVNFIMHGGVVTLSIFAICVFIYVTALINVPQLYNAFSFFNPLILENLTQPWRLFTPALLHFSSLHIIFNLLWWWYLGGQIENRISSSKLLLIFVLASSLPNLLQYFMTGPSFGGLSGVVYGLVGYFWITGKLKPTTDLQLPNAYIIFMLVWLVLGFFDVLGMPVANGAHLGGLLVGCTLAWLDHKRYSKPKDLS